MTGCFVNWIFRKKLVNAADLLMFVHNNSGIGESATLLLIIFRIDVYESFKLYGYLRLVDLVFDDMEIIFFDFVSI